MVRAVIQRVSSASVEVDGAVVGEIGSGLLALVGVRVDDAIPAGARAGEQDPHAADPGRRAFGGRCGRADAGHQPVHALRRHPQRAPSVMERCRPGTRGRAARGRGGRAASSAGRDASRPACSARRCGSAWSTKGLSRSSSTPDGQTPSARIRAARSTSASAGPSSGGRSGCTQRSRRSANAGFCASTGPCR